jgi:transposase
MAGASRTVWQVALRLHASESLVEERCARTGKGNETRQLAFDPGMVPAVPPKFNRLDAWECDRELYKKRNEIERLFRRLKGFRRIFSRFEKLDVVCLAFIHFVPIVEALG